MIQPPAYKKNAVPSLRGWRHPRTGELLKKQKLTQEQIDEYLGVGSEPEPTPEPEVVELDDDQTVEEIEEEAQEVSEEYDYDDMSKEELEEVGREHGIELDRREKKGTLIQKLKKVIS